jgi:hypothetical protein
VKNLPNFGKEGLEIFLTFGSAILEMYAKDLATGEETPKHCVDFVKK